jgi:hypothetical protein
MLIGMTSISMAGFTVMVAMVAITTQATEMDVSITSKR